MRILSKHMTPLDRQVRESLNIMKASKVAEECLNLKSEWGGSKLPGLQVHSPKGTGKRPEGQADQTGDSQGDKRIVSDPEDLGEREQGPKLVKKRRMTSPEKGNENPGWKIRPTFHTEQVVRVQPEPARKEEMKLGEQTDRTPLKARIRNINKKSLGSP